VPLGGDESIAAGGYVLCPEFAVCDRGFDAAEAHRTMLEVGHPPEQRQAPQQRLNLSSAIFHAVPCDVYPAQDLTARRTRDSAFLSPGSRRSTTFATTAVIAMR